MPVQGNSLESNASECNSILREPEKPTEEPQSVPEVCTRSVFLLDDYTILIVRGCSNLLVG